MRRVNGDASPYRYSIESADLLRIVTEIEDADEEILAIYHSHDAVAGVPLAHRRRRSPSGPTRRT